MRKQLLIGAGMIAATALLIFAGSARAEPPKMDDGVVSLPFKFVVCENKSDLQAIVDAARKGDVEEKFRELNAKFDDKGYSVCGFEAPQAIVFGDSEDVGELITASGERSHGWISHVGNARIEFWLLWSEKVEKGDPV